MWGKDMVEESTTDVAKSIGHKEPMIGVAIQDSDSDWCLLLKDPQPDVLQEWFEPPDWFALEFLAEIIRDRAIDPLKDNEVKSGPSFRGDDNRCLFVFDGVGRGNRFRNDVVDNLICMTMNFKQLRPRRVLALFHLYSDGGQIERDFRVEGKVKVDDEDGTSGMKAWAIVGTAFEVIQKKRSEKPEVCDVARDDALCEIKERIKKTKDETKAKKVEVVSKQKTQGKSGNVLKEKKNNKRLLKSISLPSSLKRKITTFKFLKSTRFLAIYKVKLQLDRSKASRSNYMGVLDDRLD
ncbi:60S ribosomal protein L24 [Tanacetum coccineum]